MTESFAGADQPTTSQPYQRIVYYTQHWAGLCNHLRSLCACLCISHFLKIPIAMYWAASPACDCEFADLFEPVCDTLAAADALEVIQNPPLGTLCLSDEHGGPAYFYQTYLRDSVAVELFWQQLTFFQRGMQIKPHLRETIDRFVRQYWQDHMVGIHVRRTDHAAIFSKNPEIAPKLSTDEKFFQAIEAEIGQGTSRFFLAADNSETEKIFKSRFPESIVTYCSVFDSSQHRQTNVQDALIDLYLLSKTKKIIGSYFSSFNEYAGWLGGIPLYHA